MLKLPTRLLVKPAPVKVMQKRGRGRPTADGATDLVCVTVSLPAHLIERAEIIGGGNLSLGLRILFADITA